MSGDPSGGPDLRRLPRQHLIVAAVVPIVLLVVFVAVLAWRAAPRERAIIGSAAPDFTLTDLEGSPVRLADLRGRPVVLNFFASWCGPCVEEFPLLREAAEEHAAAGLVIVGIVYEDRSEAVRDFMRRNDANWQALMDPGERVAAAYGILAPPETFFIDRDGTIAARQIGQFSEGSLREQLATIIER
jgi:cytochrome c biogenesis protein CcmG, thiol:disulfide interchange protein DsbE